MQQQEGILDGNPINPERNLNIQEQHLISVEKFVLLNILTMGLYNIWWSYKAWRYLYQKNELDVSPVLRAIFGILFSYSLFNSILKEAKNMGYSGVYSPEILFILFLFFNVAAYFPDPLWLLSILTFTAFLQPFAALNYAKRNAPEVVVHEQRGFNTRQIILMLLGVLIWGLFIMGLTDEASHANSGPDYNF